MAVVCIFVFLKKISSLSFGYKPAHLVTFKLLMSAVLRTQFIPTLQFASTAHEHLDSLQRFMAGLNWPLLSIGTIAVCARLQ